MVLPAPERVPHPPAGGQQLARYRALKLRIAAKRQRLATEWHRAVGDSPKAAVCARARTYFIRMLTDSVFPHWYGTAWDFNGHTNDPGVGQVACGYFVSTPVAHCALKVNRYKLAQQYSFDIVQVLCGSPVQRIGNGNLRALLQWIASRPDDLYVIGLDNHVGWLHRSNGHTWMVHSDYLGPVAVHTELADTSAALSISNNYVLGRFMHQQALVEDWLTAAPVPVPAP